MNEPIAKPHVLVVEDEQILLKFLIYHIETAGYRATAVSTGSEILPVLNSDPVDLILMDLGLPDGDGLTWTQQIRETTKVPIVVLTGRQGDDDRIMALGLGADDYLTKPCDPRELLLRMRNILERSRQTRTLSAAPSMPSTPSSPSAPSASRPTTTPNSERNRRAEKRQDRRRQDRRGHRMPGVAVIAVGAVLLLGAGAGLTWHLLGSDTAPAPEDSVAAAPSQPADDSIEQKSAPTTPTPSAAPTSPTQPQPSLSRSVTATPEKIEGGDAPLKANSGLATESETDRPVAATTYSWVLKAKCPAIPSVPWWRVRNHTEIVRYVNTRHAGDWLPYVKSWTNRLRKLKEIQARNSGIRTKTGETLTGESLQTYIGQTAQRVASVKCLSEAAADFEYRRSRLRN